MVENFRIDYFGDLLHEVLIWQVVVDVEEWVEWLEGLWVTWVVGLGFADEKIGELLIICVEGGLGLKSWDWIIYVVSAAQVDFKLLFLGKFDEVQAKKDSLVRTLLRLAFIWQVMLHLSPKNLSW